ncbi:ABC transporter substrate-binding protein [Pseudofrankia sp. DC12]|uniref:ABC transporter substrate-binding protein n=1 Tax=Pseudofrankia sp. DC12 TaxID=683315 RepID=UPI001E4EEF9F|nr:ABC transporter substrate-binding protein [Pseudofrankia sp. DC12]
MTAFVAALAASGCAGTSGPSQSCVSPGVSAHEVRIGFVDPDDGAVGKALEAARGGIDARLGLVNDAGGVYGRKITYTWQSDQSTPAGNDAAVRSLVGSSGVFGLIEASTSAAGGADYLRTLQVPTVGLPIERIWADPAYPNMFSYPSVLAGGSVSDVFGRYASGQGGHRAVIVTTDSAAAAQQFTPALEQSLAAAGISTTRLEYNSAVTSPAQLANRLRGSGTDVLALDLPSIQAPQILAATRAAGISFRAVISVAGYSDDTIQRYGSSVAGLTTFSTLVPLQTHLPAQQAYLAAAAKYAPELQTPTQDVAYGAYVATDILLRGLTAAGACPTRQGFIKSLRAVKDYNAGGLLAGQIDLTHSAGQSIKCLIFMRVNAAGSAFELVPDPLPGASSKTEWCGGGGGPPSS